jgi:pimeloyl-ACP methyl ester carboxylesterase
MHLEVITRRPETEPQPTPLLFVHGAWHGAWCWDEHFLPFFAAHGYESHAIDLRGHGASGNRRSLRFTGIADYVADVGRVVDTLDTHPVLVGHSMGGLVVQRYLEKSSAPAAVLVAPDPVGGVWRATLRVARRHPVAFVKANATMRLWPIVAEPKRARDMFFAPDMSETDADRYWSRLQDESYRAYLEMLFRPPRPRRVDTPVLVVGAEYDRLFGPGEMRRTADAYGATVVMIPGAGHDLMLDPRWEQVARSILDWLHDRDL